MLVPVDISLIPVDVVVPVYRGLAQTRRCIESVMAHHLLTPFELILIDDASPEPELSGYLGHLGRARWNYSAAQRP